MAASIYPEYPPELEPAQSDYLLSNLKDWSIINGLAVRPSPTFVSRESDPSGVLALTAPVTLFPSPFPRACFEEAKAIQEAYNELYAAIARDEEWLGEIVQELVEVDDFIHKLWQVHVAVKKEGYVQNLSLGLFRSDYMVHVDPAIPNSLPQIKQVEFNTIASSFGGLSSQVSLLHKYLLTTSSYPSHPSITPSSLPPNPTISSLSLGLSTAHAHYGPPKSIPPLPLCILFIVQTPERNVFDQRHLEHFLTSKNIPVFRLPFDQVKSHTSIPPTNLLRPLLYTPPYSTSPSPAYEVSVLYFRAAYSPTDYSSPNSWPSRLHLERSAAIKCPSILTHLAGSKKIQQVLATPSSPHLSRFLSPSLASRLQRTFAAIYPLDSSPAGRHAKALALDPEKCQKYVLKPQREGGGNNIYRSAIPTFLKTLGHENNWRGHILMELIEPPALRNSILREGVLRTGEVIGELGIYGVVLWRNSPATTKTLLQEDRDDIDNIGDLRAGGQKIDEIGVAEDREKEGVLENWEAGYLLRTKGRESEEGGVAAGFGAVDSVCLV